MSMKRASKTLVPVVLILAFGLIVGGITPASGQTSGSTSTLADAGVLRLRLGPEDHFRFEPLSGSPTTRSITLASGSLFKAVVMILVGVFLGLAGIDANAPLPRLTFGVPEMADGINFVALAVGLFGFHAVFHVLVIVAATAQLVALSLVVL